MNLHRLRQPAVGALAVLLISGAGIAFAGGPPTSGSTPGAPIVQTELTVPDTDQLQQGDQTTPDVAGAVETVETGTAAKEASTPAMKSAARTEQSAPESDGPGGHADPAGQNVDHQFDGQE